MFVTRITPRVSETDGAGHINNFVAPVWFEAGRREIFRILTPDLQFSNWKAAMVNMQVDYARQMYFHAEVEVRTWVEKIGTKSFSLYEEIWQADQRCVVGRSTYVVFDYATQQAEEISNDIRNALGVHIKQHPQPDERSHWQE